MGKLEAMRCQASAGAAVNLKAIPDIFRQNWWHFETFTCSSSGATLQLNCAKGKGIIATRAQASSVGFLAACLNYSWSFLASLVLGSLCTLDQEATAQHSGETLGKSTKTNICAHLRNKRIGIICCHPSPALIIITILYVYTLLRSSSFLVKYMTA